MLCLVEAGTCLPYLIMGTGFSCYKVSLYCVFMKTHLFIYLFIARRELGAFFLKRKQYHQSSLRASPSN